MAKKKKVAFNVPEPKPTNGQHKPQLTWFQLMWKNWYIQLFAIAVIALFGVLYQHFFVESFYSLTALLIGIGIPTGMMVMIAYKAFYQFWNDYKSGKSR